MRHFNHRLFFINYNYKIHYFLGLIYLLNQLLFFLLLCQDKQSFSSHMFQQLLFLLLLCNVHLKLYPSLHLLLGLDKPNSKLL